METVTVVLATVLRQSERTTGLQILLTTMDWLLTFTKGLLPDSKQDNIIQHKILSCQEIGLLLVDIKLEGVNLTIAS